MVVWGWAGVAAHHLFRVTGCLLCTEALHQKHLTIECIEHRGKTKAKARTIGAVRSAVPASVPNTVWLSFLL